MLVDKGFEKLKSEGVVPMFKWGVGWGCLGNEWRSTKFTTNEFVSKR